MFLDILNKNPLLGIFAALYSWIVTAQGFKNVFEIISVVLAVLLACLSIYAKILQIKNERYKKNNKK